MLLNEFNAINNTYNKIELSIKMKYALLFIFINLVNLVFNVKQGAKCPQEDQKFVQRFINQFVDGLILEEFNALDILVPAIMVIFAKLVETI